MSLKISKGNMYDWCTHMHSHLGGECPHKCSYCYVQKNRFGVSPRYQGEIRFIDKELEVSYGQDKIIFIEHMNDIFANAVPNIWIYKILQHCRFYPFNTYVFQTKNPSKAWEFVDLFPKKFMMGTTIESNRAYETLTKAPEPASRFLGMMLFSRCSNKEIKTFVTIEPILDFDIDALMEMLRNINPSFINIGADSKGCSLPEPSNEKVKQLIEQIQRAGLTIKKKVNLERMLK